MISFQGDRGPALEEAEAAITLNPNELYGHLVKGVILVVSGQNRSRPLYYHGPADHEHLLDGLRKAGWQG